MFYLTSAWRASLRGAPAKLEGVLLTSLRSLRSRPGPSEPAPGLSGANHRVRQIPTAASLRAAWQGPFLEWGLRAKETWEPSAIPAGVQLPGRGSRGGPGAGAGSASARLRARLSGPRGPGPHLVVLCRPARPRPLAERGSWYAQLPCPPRVRGRLEPEGPSQVSRQRALLPSPLGSGGGCASGAA